MDVRKPTELYIAFFHASLINFVKILASAEILSRSRSTILPCFVQTDSRVVAFIIVSVGNLVGERDWFVAVKRRGILHVTSGAVSVDPVALDKPWLAPASIAFMVYLFMGWAGLKPQIGSATMDNIMAIEAIHRCPNG